MSVCFSYNYISYYIILHSCSQAIYTAVVVKYFLPLLVQSKVVNVLPIQFNDIMPQ